MRRITWIFITLVILLAGQTMADGPSVYVQVKIQFDDARDEIENAILSQGLVVDSNSKVGEMLNRTAPDLGIQENVYNRAETWHFCSALLSHQLIAADPHNIAFCPYVIFAYETTQSPGEVVIGYRKPALQGSAETVDVLTKIDRLLRSIIESIES